MVRTTALVAALLAAVGVIGYVGSGAESPTALLPLLLGAVLFGLARWAIAQPDRRRAAMHIALAVALLGLLGSAGRLGDLGAWVQGDDVDAPWAIGANLAVVVILAGYLAAGVRSFVAARRSADGALT